MHYIKVSWGGSIASQKVGKQGLQICLVGLGGENFEDFHHPVAKLVVIHGAFHKIAFFAARHAIGGRVAERIVDAVDANAPRRLRVFFAIHTWTGCQCRKLRKGNRHGSLAATGLRLEVAPAKRQVVLTSLVPALALRIWRWLWLQQWLWRWLQRWLWRWLQRWLWLQRRRCRCDCSNTAVFILVPAPHWFAARLYHLCPSLCRGHCRGKCGGCLCAEHSTLCYCCEIVKSGRNSTWHLEGNTKSGKLECVLGT